MEDAGDEAIDRLLLEPVLATKFLPKGSAVALDLGSGGGSPAIPMKLAAPDLSLRMVESKTRKAAFLRETVRSLELDRTAVDAVRFEELLARPGLHDAIDVVTLRAVRVDRKTLATIQCFIKPGGLLFLFGSMGPAAADLGAPYLSPIGKPCPSQPVGKPPRDSQEAGIRLSASIFSLVQTVPRGTVWKADFN